MDRAHATQTISVPVRKIYSINLIGKEGRRSLNRLGWKQLRRIC